METNKLRALVGGAVAVAAVGVLTTEALAGPAGAARTRSTHARVSQRTPERPDAAVGSAKPAATPLELAVELAMRENQETLDERAAIARYIEASIAAEQAEQARLAAERAARVQGSRTSRGGSSGGATSGSHGSTLACIRAHESDSAGGYSAVNSSSGAGGAYQALPSTWDGYAGYARAEHAPADVQDRWAREAIAAAGTRPWAGSGC